MSEFVSVDIINCKVFGFNAPIYFGYKLQPFSWSCSIRGHCSVLCSYSRTLQRVLQLFEAIAACFAAGQFIRVVHVDHLNLGSLLRYKLKKNVKSQDVLATKFSIIFNKPLVV